MKRLLVVCAVLVPVSEVTPLAAQVERIEIESTVPVAGGKAYGLAGAYERLRGKVYLAADPADPHNRGIVDLDKAPRGKDGKVHYSTDIFIIRPVDPAKGNRTLLAEISNRGGKASLFYFNRGARGSLDPVGAEQMGDGFLLRNGFTLVWIGWQYDVPDREGLVRLYPAYATDGGKPIQGLVRADEVFPNDRPVMQLAHRNHVPYAVSDPGDPRNVLTVRDTPLGQRHTIPRTKWGFGSVDPDGTVKPGSTSIWLEGGFEKGKIYEVVYVAERPAVVGLGFTAIRDVVTWLKTSPESPAPARYALSIGISQTGRWLRHFFYQGFNTNLGDGRALDGAIVQTAGGGRGSFNHRFGQPSRDAHPFSAFFYPTDIFPFTDLPQTDPETGLTDGILVNLTAAGTAPRIFYTNSSYEYWGRAASLIHTSVDGTRDFEIPGNVRIYNFSGAQHFVDRFPPARRGTRYPANPNNFLWVIRALLLDLREWVVNETPPPPSRYPRIDKHTLVRPEELAFPAIPGVEVPRYYHEAYRADYGPRFRSEGIVDIQPPRIGKAFPILVSQVDEDGNETGGLRTPEVEVPLATYTPWNLRSEEIGAPEQMADFRGSFLLFPGTVAEREARHDPRRSIAERYKSREDYIGRYTNAAVELVNQRFLLAEDLPEMIEHAKRLWSYAVEGR